MFPNARLSQAIWKTANELLSKIGDTVILHVNDSIISLGNRDGSMERAYGWIIK